MKLNAETRIYRTKFGIVTLYLEKCQCWFTGYKAIDRSFLDNPRIVVKIEYNVLGNVMSQIVRFPLKKGTVQVRPHRLIQGVYM